jgi:hypothetical protein
MARGPPLGINNRNLAKLDEWLFTLELSEDVMRRAALTQQIETARTQSGIGDVLHGNDADLGAGVRAPRGNCR